MAAGGTTVRATSRRSCGYPKAKVQLSTTRGQVIRCLAPLPAPGSTSRCKNCARRSRAVTLPRQTAFGRLFVGCASQLQFNVVVRDALPRAAFPTHRTDECPKQCVLIDIRIGQYFSDGVAKRASHFSAEVIDDLFNLDSCHGGAPFLFTNENNCSPSMPRSAEV